MKINEVFPNPTVKQVIFQIKYANLFYIENKIADIQYKILDKFPESALINRRQILFADVGPDTSLSEIKGDNNVSTRIWQFKSSKGYNLNIVSDSMSIVSNFHKTYDFDGADKFRDIIQFVLNTFFEIVPIPVLTRVGLRYIDECPISKKTNTSFLRYYNSVFPLKRFNLADAIEMRFRTVVKKGEHNIIYSETLSKTNNEYKLILDFDGYAVNINPSDCINVTDALHTLIRNEYETTIKEPVITYMRKERS